MPRDSGNPSAYLDKYTFDVKFFKYSLFCSFVWRLNKADIPPKYDIHFKRPIESRQFFNQQKAYFVLIYGKIGLICALHYLLFVL